MTSSKALIEKHIAEGETPSEPSVTDESKEKQAQAIEAEQREPKHLHGLPLALVVTGLVLCLFLPALDQLILSKSNNSKRFFASLIFNLAPAMPRIVSQFNSLTEVCCPGQRIA